MDTLSRLIDLARPQASLDLRCLLTGGFDIDHAPMEAGVAPFHLVLDGAAHRVRDVGRAAATAPTCARA